jgi:hypothetical protein
MTHSDDRWRGWLVPGGALIVAAVIVIVAVVSAAQSTAPTPSTAPSASPSNASGGDEHTVVTADETVTVRQVGGAIEVERVAGVAPGVLARIEANLEVPASGQTPVASSTSFYVIACGTDPNTERRYIVGHMEGRLPLKYQGPPAVGHGAADGLFLYALDVGPVDPLAPVRIQGNDGSGMVGLGGATFDQARTEGTKQPSGCWTMG